MKRQHRSRITSNSALLSKEPDSRRAIGMLGPEYLLKRPELQVTATDQLEGQTDFLEMIWHQWEMTSRDSVSSSATQAAHSCRCYLLCLKAGVIILTILWMRERFRELKWLLESHRARALQKQNARAMLPKANHSHTHTCYPTVVPSRMQNLGLPRPAHSQWAS